ncbi:MAG TPA: hypothetical protein VIX35_06960 [Vicinamibacterales bacterium]
MRATFSGNQVVANVFRDFVTGTLPPGYVFPVMTVTFATNGGGGSVSGNLIQGNDFGTQAGPALTPLLGFIDGGGNICGPIPSSNPIGSA